MKLIRIQRPTAWESPFDRLTNLREEINRLFDVPSGDLGRETEFFTGWSPALDVYEDKDNLTVKAELPGMKKEQIELSVHDNTLTISGERKVERTESDGEPSRAERFFGRFQRTVTLAKPVDVNKVNARYKDGILTITLPKTEESKPRQIEVKVS
jgi:HSP20 family protein